MRLFNQDNMNLSVHSEVKWGIRKLEVALALDNIGSMAQAGKLTNLKTAAHNLLTTLRNAAKNPGDIKVAIIPFTTTVNLGTSYKDNDWFDISSLDCNGSQSGSGCMSTNWKNYWQGCVRDRTYPYDAQDDAPSALVPATLFPVYACGTLATLMPLSYDSTALNNKVDAMTSSGNTDDVLRRAAGQSAQRRVHGDRAEPRQPADCQIANRRERSVRTANEKARPEPGFCFQPSAAITSRLPWRYRPRMAGRPPAQDRHKARRTWSPGQGIARRRP